MNVGGGRTGERRQVNELVIGVRGAQCLLSRNKYYSLVVYESANIPHYKTIKSKMADG